MASEVACFRRVSISVTVLAFLASISPHAVATYDVYLANAAHEGGYLLSQEDGVGRAFEYRPDGRMVRLPDGTVRKLADFNAWPAEADLRISKMR
jgi:hypothetical protein